MDDGPPTVTITAPQDGAMVPSDFTVTADVQDVFGGLEVSLTIIEANLTVVDDNDPLWVYEWPVQGVPDGLWTLEVSATDADGNVTAEQIQVCVGQSPCDGGGSTSGTSGGSSTGGSGGSSGGSSGSGTTGGSTSTTTTGPPSSTAGGLLGGDDPSVGCGCRSTTPTPAPVLWSLAFLAWFRRRSTGPVRTTTARPR